MRFTVKSNLSLVCIVQTSTLLTARTVCPTSLCAPSASYLIAYWLHLSVYFVTFHCRVQIAISDVTESSAQENITHVSVLKYMVHM